MINFNLKKFEKNIPSDIKSHIVKIIKKLSIDFDVDLGGSHYLEIDYNLAENPKLKSDIDLNFVKTIVSFEGWEQEYKKDISKIHDIVALKS